MEKTSIQLIKEAASKLRDNKLKRLNCKEISSLLEGIMCSLDFECREEALLFSILFDRSCDGSSSDLDDIAMYLGCSRLDIIEYLPMLELLVSKGLVVFSNMHEFRLEYQSYLVTSSVINSIARNRKPGLLKSYSIKINFDRYDFCKMVSAQYDNCNIPAYDLMFFVEDIEGKNKDMPFIKDLVAAVDCLSARILFYKVCFDYFSEDGEGCTPVRQVLERIFDNYGERISTRKKLYDGTHTLVCHELIELSDDGEVIRLAKVGQQMFLREDYGAYDNQCKVLDRYSFVREIANYIHQDFKSNSRLAERRLKSEVCSLENSASDVESIKKIRSLLPDVYKRVFFYILCDACALSENASLSRELSYIYNTKDRLLNIKLFKDKKHVLQNLGLAELYSVNNMFGEFTAVRLTDEGKKLYFEEESELFIDAKDNKNIILASEIKEKRLFFSENENKQLVVVGNALQERNYSSLVERLASKGLSRGIAVLLYGAPGTGKTESVMQWARQTGRDIVHVDISAAKSMWFGESEKIVKDIFVKYKNLCNRSSVKPILLFNEADAIFSKRRSMETGRGTDQTENAIQNILLEEIEKLEGILIATTNLADNLDKAFERRFLFKIRFDKPSVEAKRNIWMDKMPSLTYETASMLASDYDFSGGEIDNIVRKAIMLEVIDGRVPSAEAINRLCSEEKIRSSRIRVGFN